ncbi:MAG: bifunctional UDP-N-acetylglucosamine diphosphorylase/glucosamine-1-phosphate N-acetyltransferase GlmU [Tissierellia bacterium]|nr:bifunctional UDP-N-acetylglucosamine diphosphorylase/glucosamine-1-phosphate N-acetyltransferase GlmU [Tissierellia bacterium]
MDKTIILAAGEGTRMKSKKSKVLHKILNHTILEYVIEASNLSENSQTIVIAGNNKEQIENNFKNIIIRKQEIGHNIPYGTGYAVSCAKDLIDDDDNILVLNGDIPLIRKETLKDFLNSHKQNKMAVSVLSTKLEDPTGYGRIIRDENGNFSKIVEQKDCLESQLEVNEINTGIYAFNGEKLKFALSKLNTNNNQGELYLTDCIEILKNDNQKVAAFSNLSFEEFFGVNNKFELENAEKIMRMRINKKHMIDGVILHNPEYITIDKDAKIDIDTEIFAPCSILGKSEIGKNCVVKSNSRIENSKIYDDVIIDSSVIEDSVVEKGVDIGPFSHLRPKAHLKENVHIGNFVEVKNATVGKNTKAGHLAYVGDADLGEDINIGCGVIFVNYDGKYKHRSVVEDKAFIGSNSNIVAPVYIEKEGYIAAGSTITKKVHQGELAIERAEEKFIKGYVEKKKIRDMKREEK